MFTTGGDIELSLPLTKTIFEVHFQNGRTVLKSGWTAKLVEFIWDKLHIACCFSFQRGRYRTKDIIAEGRCSQSTCSTTITIVQVHNCRQLEVSINNYKANVYHDPDKKRRMLPVEKKDFAEKLKHRSASAVRNEILDAAMNVENCPEPAHVYGLNAARIVKCRENLAGRSGDAIQSLYDMKNEFVNCIQHIGLDPFYVMFETVAQRTYYKREVERKRSIISIDATGLGLMSPNRNKTYIFLYLISCHGK